MDISANSDTNEILVPFSGYTLEAIIFTQSESGKWILERKYLKGAGTIDSFSGIVLCVSDLSNSQFTLSAKKSCRRTGVCGVCSGMSILGF